MYCPNCGVSGHGDFCTECGQSLFASMDDSNTSPSQVRFSRLPKLLAFGAILISVLSIGGGLWLYTEAQNKAEEARLAAIEVSRFSVAKSAADSALREASEKYDNCLYNWNASDYACRILFGDDSLGLMLDKILAQSKADEYPDSKLRILSSNQERVEEEASTLEAIAPIALFGGSTVGVVLGVSSFISRRRRKRAN